MKYCWCGSLVYSIFSLLGKRTPGFESVISHNFILVMLRTDSLWIKVKAILYNNNNNIIYYFCFNGVTMEDEKEEADVHPKIMAWSSCTYRHQWSRVIFSSFFFYSLVGCWVIKSYKKEKRVPVSPLSFSIVLWGEILCYDVVF